MRTLTRDETTEGEVWEESTQWAHAVAIEATVSELAELGMGTCCGRVGNECFVTLRDNGFGDRLIRGSLFKEIDCGRVAIAGMVHIQTNARDANKIDRLAAKGDGSLRFNGRSVWKGFKSFEVE